LRIVLAACAVLALTGCKGTIMPQLASPGSAGYQRYQALQYDPYPLDDVAPPVAGTRPKEYDRPIPEVTRGRLFHYPQPGEPTIAAPSFGPAVAPPITAPPVMSSAPVSAAAPPAIVPYTTTPVTIVPTGPSVRAPY
jgi:hypothetical protein